MNVRKEIKMRQSGCRNRTRDPFQKNPKKVIVDLVVPAGIVKNRVTIENRKIPRPS